MTLNHDCFRDILLILEKEQAMEVVDNSFLDGGISELSGRVKEVYSPQLLKHSDLAKYSREDIIYSIKQMGECDLLNVEECLLGDDCVSYCVYDITSNGHEFLSNIKSDTNWSKTKNIAKKVGAFSLNALSQIAVRVISSNISTFFTGGSAPTP